jgi:riboflavin kinase/FMN adenylyltransferase
MELFTSLDAVQLSGSWVTIGAFDGVHLGHQALLTRLVHGAHAAGLPAVVITFHPHPVEVLRGLQGPFYLMSPEQRAAEMGSLGVDVIVTLEFTRAMAAWSAREFMEHLSTHLGLRHLLIGHDFALGRNREGSLPVLVRLGETLGYTVDEVQPVSASTEVISSTRIRDLLNQGQVAQAALLLGRRFALEGRIVHGDARGRRIGIPTANLDLPANRLVPAHGVYATLAYVDGLPVQSVTNIGVRPTFENQPVLSRVETHLLDFKRDLYGLPLRLEFAAFLRPEQRFDSIEALVSQIHQDISTTREVLHHEP